MYGNEKELGLALKELLPKHNLTRKDIFVTTKLCKCINSLINIQIYFWKPMKYPDIFRK